MGWRILRWMIAFCIFSILIIAVCFFAVPEEIITPLDLEEESQINTYSFDLYVAGREVIVNYENGDNRIVLKKFKLPNRKLFLLIDQAEIQEGIWGKELVVKTKTIWPLCVGAFFVCLVFSVGISMILKSYIR